MQKNKIDQGLDFKKRARRRLVGAIALVFLMVIILPMILEDREASAPNDAIEITMPNQDAADIVVDEQIEANDEIVELPSDDTVTAKVIDLPKPKALPKAKEVVKPEAPAEIEKPVKPEPPTVASVKKPAKEAVKPSNKFYVQIGVFSDASNVKKLQTKLGDLGYESVTEKMTTDKGEKTRLRTKVFEGRNEAAIALENIKDSGLTGMVVNQK